MAKSARETWSRLVEQWAKSGLTRQEFATKSGVNGNSLAHWKWMLAREARLAGSTIPKFVEVVAPPPQSEGLELVLAGGLRVRIPHGFDAAELRRLLQVLGVRG
jgi:hypothetical protein